MQFVHKGLSFIIYRAIDFNALIGTIGGYIGLFLGYSILQIPDFLNQMAKNISKNCSKSKLKRKLEPLQIKINKNCQLSVKDLVLKPNTSNEEIVDILKHVLISHNDILERLVKLE